MDERHLRNALGRFVTGVTVITTRTAAGRLEGLTANSFAAVSLDPPLVLWSLKAASSTLPSFQDAGHFAVNVLGAWQFALSQHFAKRSEDKFQNVVHAPGLGGCPLLFGADGPKAAATAGEVGDGILYGGSMDPEVRARRLAAGRTRPEQEAWIAPTVSLGETHDQVREDLGAMVVAMANRAMRGDLAERGVPAELHPDVEAMWASYDYGFHADNSRPRNTGVVSDALASHLIDSLCLWGDEERWGGLLAELEEEGWTGLMLILGQATQLGVLTEIGARLQRLGHLTPA